MSAALAEVSVEPELASLCGVLNASYAQLVTLVAQTLADESWTIGGVHSPEHWLTMRAGLSPFRARTVVAIARRAGELPTVMDQFAQGQLSIDQVGVIARYAPAHVEASVAELAINASVPQLRRCLSHYSFDPPAKNGYAQPDPTGKTGADDTAVGDTEAGVTGTADTGTGEQGTAEQGTAEQGTGDTGAGEQAGWNGFALEKDRATAPAELSTYYDEWGRFTLRFTAPADLGAIVEAALQEAKDALFHAGQPKVTMGDALVEIAKRSLGTVESINRRDTFRTYVHLDAEGAWLNGKPRLPRQITEKLTCDGILQPVWSTQGVPVNVGRAQRIVPARTRRLVEDRDRGCRYPGCVATAHVECHHVIHWAHGGPTDTWNLCCLCDFHHDGHHDGEFTITGNADDPLGLSFTTRGGFPIPHGPTFTTPPGPATPPDTPYTGPTGHTLDLGWVTFHEPPTPGPSPGTGAPAFFHDPPEPATTC